MSMACINDDAWVVWLEAPQWKRVDYCCAAPLALPSGPTRPTSLQLLIRTPCLSPILFCITIFCHRHHACHQHLRLLLVLHLVVTIIVITITPLLDYMFYICILLFPCSSPSSLSADSSFSVLFFPSHIFSLWDLVSHYFDHLSVMCWFLLFVFPCSSSSACCLFLFLEFATHRREKVAGPCELRN